MKHSNSTEQVTSPVAGTPLDQSPVFTEAALDSTSQVGARADADARCPLFSTVDRVGDQVYNNPRKLLDNFVDNVLPLIFPILGFEIQSPLRSNLIRSALEQNETYYHCCLSMSAFYLKATERLHSELVDKDIHYWGMAISSLRKALEDMTCYQEIIEAILGIIFLQCSMSQPEDHMSGIPWHGHFQAIILLVGELDLIYCNDANVGNLFNMSIIYWVDILGSTMRGCAPHFADFYSCTSSIGLCEVMGCDDRTMFLISEIACLEAAKLGGMDDQDLCEKVWELGLRFEPRDSGAFECLSPHSAAGATSTVQPSNIITAVFHLAARLYLCSLIPGLDITQPPITELVSEISNIVRSISAGISYDRSLVWPYLIAGSTSTATSPFRSLLLERIKHLGAHAELGSFGRMVRLLKELWTQRDNGRQNITWRGVMEEKGWDFLVL